MFWAAIVLRFVWGLRDRGQTSRAFYASGAAGAVAPARAVGARFRRGVFSRILSARRRTNQTTCHLAALLGGPTQTRSKIALGVTAGLLALIASGVVVFALAGGQPSPVTASPSGGPVQAAASPSGPLVQTTASSGAVRPGLSAGASTNYPCGAVMWLTASVKDGSGRGVRGVKVTFAYPLTTGIVRRYATTDSQGAVRVMIQPEPKTAPLNQRIAVKVTAVWDGATRAASTWFTPKYL
jgi:hypothetical protein